MTRIIRGIGILALVLAAGCGKKDAQVVMPTKPSDTEVAVWVDQTGLTSGQIQREASRLFANVPKDLTPEQVQTAQVKALQQAIDNLVVRELVRAEMARSGILISQAEIDKGKADLEKGMGPGRSLMMLIAEANLPVEELENNLRLDLFKNKVLKDKIAAGLAEVTDESVKAYYDEHPEEFTEPEGRLASQIFVQVPADADEAAKKDLLAKAEGIRKALVEGADFEKLAREVSDSASRSRGGALGVIPRGREAPAFEEAVYSQNIGDIGEVVESPVGYHIIKVTGEQEQKLIPFDEVKDRLDFAMKTRIQQKITADYIEELKNKATIKLAGPLANAAAKAEPSAAKEKGAEATPVLPPAAEAPATVPAP